MKELTGYYVSRAVLAVVFAALAWIVTHSIWWAVGIGLLGMAAFVWYARSGHFMVDEGRPLAPLRRDERERAITFEAGTYAFVAVMLLVAGLGLVGLLDGQWSAAVILAGFAVYFVMRGWLRRTR